MKKANLFLATPLMVLCGYTVTAHQLFGQLDPVFFGLAVLATVVATAMLVHLERGVK